MKEETHNHRNGNYSTEEEDPQEEETKEETEEETKEETEEEMKEETEEEMEEEDHHRVHQEARHMESTQCPPDQTYLLTYNPSPVLKMQKQWENFQTSSTETKPRPNHSSTS